MTVDIAPWKMDDDERRRLFIMDRYANPEQETGEHIQDLDILVQWLKHGKYVVRTSKVEH